MPGSVVPLAMFFFGGFPHSCKMTIEHKKSYYTLCNFRMTLSFLMARPGITFLLLATTMLEAQPDDQDHGHGHGHGHDHDDYTTTVKTHPDEGCCRKKIVGSVSFTLVPDAVHAKEVCHDNCVYTVTGTSWPRYCFQRGDSD